MSKKMNDLRDMLCEELWKVSKKGEISSPAELEAIDKLTHSIKSIDTIMAMEESKENDYSERGYSKSYNNSSDSYARGNNRYTKRDSMGRYSRDNSMRYSYDDSKEAMLEHIEQMMNSNTDERMRQAIRDFKYQIESM